MNIVVLHIHINTFDCAVCYRDLQTMKIYISLATVNDILTVSWGNYRITPT